MRGEVKFIGSIRIYCEVKNNFKVEKNYNSVLSESVLWAHLFVFVSMSKCTSLFIEYLEN